MKTKIFKTTSILLLITFLVGIAFIYSNQFKFSFVLAQQKTIVDEGLTFEEAFGAVNPNDQNGLATAIAKAVGKNKTDKVQTMDLSLKKLVIKDVDLKSLKGIEALRNLDTLEIYGTEGYNVQLHPNELKYIYKNFYLRKLVLDNVKLFNLPKDFAELFTGRLNIFKAENNYLPNDYLLQLNKIGLHSLDWENNKLSNDPKNPYISQTQKKLKIDEDVNPNFIYEYFFNSFNIYTDDKKRLELCNRYFSKFNVRSGEKTTVWGSDENQTSILNLNFIGNLSDIDGDSVRIAEWTYDKGTDKYTGLRMFETRPDTNGYTGFMSLSVGRLGELSEYFFKYNENAVSDKKIALRFALDGDAHIDPIPAVSYLGPNKVYEPEITVRNERNIIIDKSNYTITYTNNDKPGVATVKVSITDPKAFVTPELINKVSAKNPINKEIKFKISDKRYIDLLVDCPEKQVYDGTKNIKGCKLVVKDSKTGNILTDTGIKFIDDVVYSTLKDKYVGEQDIIHLIDPKNKEAFSSKLLYENLDNKQICIIQKILFNKEKINVLQATPEVVVKPEAIVLKAGLNLGKVGLTGGQIKGIVSSNLKDNVLKGIWKWIEPNKIITKTDYYKAEFIPQDSNYSSIKLDVKVTLKAAPVSSSKGKASVVATDKKSANAKLKEISSSDINKAINKNNAKNNSINNDKYEYVVYDEDVLENSENDIYDKLPQTGGYISWISGALMLLTGLFLMKFKDAKFRNKK